MLLHTITLHTHTNHHSNTPHHTHHGVGSLGTSSFRQVSVTAIKSTSIVVNKAESSSNFGRRNERLRGGNKEIEFLVVLCSDSFTFSQITHVPLFIAISHTTVMALSVRNTLINHPGRGHKPKKNPDLTVRTENLTARFLKTIFFVIVF